MSNKKRLRKILKQILRVERRVVSLQIDTPAPFFYATCPVCGAHGKDYESAIVAREAQIAGKDAPKEEGEI